MLVTLGSRADDTHVTCKDIKELGKLVYSACTDDAADMGDPVVLLARRMRTSVLLGINDHGTELQDHEVLAVLGYTLLLEEYGAMVFDLDGKRSDEEDRTEYDKRKA